ncbi:unnamed protein product [Dicrocoelium dendriticum]|nr:unnamed protein product [Dicrocoelium dendriticum]
MCRLIQSRLIGPLLSEFTQTAVTLPAFDEETERSVPITSRAPWTFPHLISKPLSIRNVSSPYGALYFHFFFDRTANSQCPVITSLI